MKATKIKKDRFKRVVERRTNKVINAMRLLGRCGNRVSYAYTDEEVEHVLAAIDAARQRLEDSFDVDRPITFSLTKDTRESQ